MLESEKVLHEKIRNKVINYTCFGVKEFTVATIPETEMGFVLSQIPDRHFAKKRELKKWFARESEFRKLPTQNTMPIQGKLNFGSDNDIDKLPFKNSTMHKTILVIYTNRKLDNPGYKQRYAFNTTDNLVEGDMINSPNYETNMQVVAVLDKAFKYFNKDTGDLTNMHNNSKLFPIRTLKLVESNDDVVIASKISKG